MDIYVRWWIELDTPQVLEIERLNYGADAYDKAHYMALLRERNVIGLVAEYQTKIVGFCLYELRKGNNLILIVQTHPDYCNMGVATKLVDKIKQKVLSNDQRRFVLVEVMESNLKALNFFKKNGFVAFKIVKNDYLDSDDDGILMKWDKVLVPNEEKQDIVL